MRATEVASDDGWVGAPGAGSLVASMSEPGTVRQRQRSGVDELAAGIPGQDSRSDHGADGAP